MFYNGENENEEWLAAFGRGPVCSNMRARDPMTVGRSKKSLATAREERHELSAYRPKVLHVWLGESVQTCKQLHTGHKAAGSSNGSTRAVWS